MTSALTGLVLIVLLAVLAVVLGGLTRLLASAIAGPAGHGAGRDRSWAARIASADALVARELRPDATQPMARIAPEGGGAGTVLRDPEAESPEPAMSAATPAAAVLAPSEAAPTPAAQHRAMPSPARG
ncbi:hypothetical protein [Brachybacterium sp. YJGR34]|uniref:hypothetical protein n=1 Tax=Brachybacterium sp. YJGR34 TaxID=2059911 RepID=UPI000E0A6978|nr:hypothetical protein [Brachybacterium sp. YJGR34]